MALAYTVGSVSGPVLTGWATVLFPAVGLPIMATVAVLAFVAVWAATSWSRRGLTLEVVPAIGDGVAH